MKPYKDSYEAKFILSLNWRKAGKKRTKHRARHEAKSQIIQELQEILNTTDSDIHLEFDADTNEYQVWEKQSEDWWEIMDYMEMENL